VLVQSIKIKRQSFGNLTVKKRQDIAKILTTRINMNFY